MSSKNSQTRERILDSAWKLLEAGGQVRMADIAKDAGVSRQAVYLHYPNRADLLIATTRHIDQVKDVDGRLAASRSARTGIERLDAFVEAWGNYIPEIIGVGRALMAMQDTDAEAGKAWADRMRAVREGCQAVVEALLRDGNLRAGIVADEATDLLWALLSVRHWQQLVVECGWPQTRYVDVMKATARLSLTNQAG